MCPIGVGSFRRSQSHKHGSSRHPPRSPLRLLFSSIHCYLDPASGAALCTRELLAAREMHCRVLTTEILDPESDTALDEVLAAMELPDRRFQAEL